MASNVIKTTQYEASAQDLLGGLYTLGENLYISKQGLKITNKVADAILIGTDAGGIIATLEEVPSLTTDGARMVVRLKNLGTVLLSRVKTLLGATEL